MLSRRRRFTREFKIEKVKLVTDSNNSVNLIATDMGIHPMSLYRWVQQYSENPQEAFTGTGYMTSEAEMIRQLNRENERFKMACTPRRNGSSG